MIQRLAKIQKKGYMYGHQDDTFYGITWDWDLNRSDTYELVGDFPAVMGFDLGGIEMADSKNLDSVPFERIRQEIIRQHERGGIVTISWHPRNPLLGSTAWIASDTTAYNQAVDALGKLRQNEMISQLPNPKHTVRSILPGGKKHELYNIWVKRVSDFLVSLKDNKGNQIPLIFRPWHENNGSWFWWGQDNCSDEEFHALWNYTQDCINAVPIASSTLKDYLVWSYSPNLSGAWTEAEWLVRYPGDDRVDLIGEDAYQWGTEADFIKQLDSDLNIITKIASERGKLIAVTECGYQNSPDSTWWQRVFRPLMEKYPVCYFLPWRNYSKDHFGASPAATTADDFKAWAKQKRFLFVNDIKKIK
ncbi:MAG: glycoside hydrolase family 26 protein [Prevotella sp.]|nr:glycoside hydrolase family 26 protein [Prevotella sp.]MDD7069084.1 glycosyl hydrolase [Prevotella sp.]